MIEYIYTTDETDQITYNVDSNGNWTPTNQTDNPNQTPTGTTLTPRVNGGIGTPFYKAPTNINNPSDPIVKGYGARGEEPKYFITKSGLIVQPKEIQKKAIQYTNIEKAMNCDERVKAIDSRIGDIYINAKILYLALQNTLKPSDFEVATKVIPLVVSLVNKGLGTIVSIAAKINYQSTKEIQELKVQQMQNTLIAYEVELKTLLEKKQGCEAGKLEDLIPIPRNANVGGLTNNEIIGILVLVAVLAFIYYKRKKKST